MRSTPVIVGLGLVILLLMSVLYTIPSAVRTIEADLSARSAAVTARHAGEVRSLVLQQDVTLTGVVPDESVRERLLGDVAALRGVVRVVDQLSIVSSRPRVAPSAYTFEAAREAKQVVLSGFVPDDTRRASLVGRARATFAPLRVVDRLRLAPDPPANYDDVVEQGLSQLAQMPNGSFRFNGRRGVLSGIVRSAAEREDIEAGLAAQGGELVARLRLSPEEESRRAQCESALDEALASGSIRFSTSSDVLRPGGEAVLDALATTLAACGDLTVRVEGHTDSAGDPAQNLSLSERRAETVRGELIARGVVAERLVAEGFGDQQPVSSNATRAGRAANRRIDLTVIP